MHSKGHYYCLMILLIRYSSGQNQCGEYITNVTTVGGGEIGDQVELYCSYNCTNYRTTTWSFIDANGEEKDVYGHILGIPDDAQPGPGDGYENRVNFTYNPSNSNTVLTVFSINCNDTAGYWKCNVVSSGCSTGESDSQALENAKVLPKEIHMYVNGIERTEDEEIEKDQINDPVDILCSVTASNPYNITMTDYDESSDIQYTSNCVGGCPQNCSSYGKFASMSIQCTVKVDTDTTLYKRVQFITRGNGGLSRMGIVLICVGVVAFIAVVALIAVVIVRRGCFRCHAVSPRPLKTSSKRQPFHVPAYAPSSIYQIGMQGNAILLGNQDEYTDRLEQWVKDEKVMDIPLPPGVKADCRKFLGGNNAIILQYCGTTYVIEQIKCTDQFKESGLAIAVVSTGIVYETQNGEHDNRKKLIIKPTMEPQTLPQRSGNDAESAEVRRLNEVGIETDLPRNHQMALLDRRLESFEAWTEHDKQDPEVLAEAGFYFVGHTDSVRCFWCTGGLKNCEGHDDPWFQHARWFPKCGYVKRQKGQAFIDSVQDTAKEDEVANLHEGGSDYSACENKDNTKLAVTHRDPNMLHIFTTKPEGARLVKSIKLLYKPANGKAVEKMNKELFGIIEDDGVTVHLYDWQKGEECGLLRASADFGLPKGDYIEEIGPGDDDETLNVWVRNKKHNKNSILFYEIPHDLHSVNFEARSKTTYI